MRIANVGYDIRWKKRVLVSFLLLGGFSAGCLASKSPDVQYYTFEALAEPLATTPTDPEDGGLAIALVAIRLPSYLEHQQIVTRPGHGRIEYDDFHRWAGRLDAEIFRVLGENLAILLGSDRIVSYPSLAPFPLDYQISIEFDRFDADRPGDAELQARFHVQPGSGGDALVVEGLDLREPVASKNHADLARAHSVLLSRLSNRIAERVLGLANAND